MSKQELFEAMLQKSLDARMSTMNRRIVIRNAAIAGGAVAAMGTFGFASAQDATPEEGMDEGTPMSDSPFESEVDVLNYALTLEHLESAFYRDGLAMIGEQGIVDAGFQPSVFANLTAIGEHEAAHVEALTAVITDLGGEPVAEAEYNFGITDAASFLALSQALEDTGTSAYGGAAQYLIENDDLLTAALTIHGVEARHAAYVALLNQGNPFPEAFNPSLTPDEVLEIATPLFAQ